MTLDLHPFAEMGDPSIEGSGAWHLVHLAQIFRTHAQYIVGEDEIERWGAFPDVSIETLPMVVEGLIDDCDRFCSWCRANLDRCVEVEYGGEHSFEDMLGIMLRHVIWHAAAVHYWCVWKR